jgi:ribosome-binding protein aMBF1 (putative translation factor)
MFVGTVMAARRVERKQPIPLTEAKRLECALLATFGKNLLSARNAAQLSQQALGDATNLSPNYLGRAERGSANVSLGVVARLAAILKVSPALLLSDNI